MTQNYFQPCTYIKLTLILFVAREFWCMVTCFKFEKMAYFTFDFLFFYVFCHIFIYFWTFHYYFYFFATFYVLHDVELLKNLNFFVVIMIIRCMLLLRSNIRFTFMEMMFFFWLLVFWAHNGWDFYFMIFLLFYVWVNFLSWWIM